MIYRCTPEAQFIDDAIDMRDHMVLHMIESEGMMQKDVAKKFRISNSRCFQLYNRAKRKRHLGLL